MKGFTVIVVVILGIAAAAILGILTTVAIPAFQGHIYDPSHCVAGYKFFGDRQMIGPNGGGIQCGNPN